ncbi:capsular polysaccharide biosynthesis protein [Parapedobacter defluvii]|uniref:Capsular polysaccharide biosynthesis protein n=1 Tax=Parapedobacter defluvii TaxID=2045106 RepID=A0ABQ1LEP6_9SPHI|nr:nucleoside-diphosphate sugar epimerase/dehydratase [Parapedobacter defluvii]GGC23065.1 capsular polysaccharide biosynthesis protein [Parapedobacter defluvii]
MFDKFNIVPRWIIFTLDLCCSAFALFFATLLLNSFTYDTIHSADFNRELLVVLFVSAVVFYRLKMYAGIVRYTSALDSVRILSSVALCVIILFLLNTVLVALNRPPLLSNSLLIAYGLMNFLLLITYRSTVKLFFLYIKNMKVNRRQIVIYGAGDVGIAAKRTLDHDHTSNKVVVGFIDDNFQKVGKIIDGVRIYHTDYFEQLAKQDKVDEVIISSHNIPIEKKASIVDFCLERNIKVLTMPPVHRLINGEVTPNQIQKMRIEDLLEREPIKINNQSIRQQLSGKRILVTGAAGSIGSEIARQLGKYAPQMIILNDQAETPLHELQLELEDLQKNQVYHAFIGDIRDQDRMEALFKTFKPHYVYHAAAYKHVPMMENHPVEAVRTNIMGTRLLARLAVAYGVEKFVMISTDKAVNPTNVMGASKRIAEIYVQTYFQHLSQREVLLGNGNDAYTRFITTRFGNVLGSNGSVIPRFKAQIEKGGPVTVTHPEITRFFMTIPEACQLVLEAGSMGNGGEIYVFDMGKSVKIVELANKMIKLSGLVPNKDINIQYSGLRPGEKLYEELLNDLENTLPTHHHKIMIAKVREYDFDGVEARIDQLINLTKNQNEREIVLKMKELVPEFKSNNSIFEELDKKTKNGINL